VEVVVSAGRKMADEIVADLRIAVPLVAAFCGLSQDFFKCASGPEFSPIMNDA
jgi:hypothetical protein